MSPHKISDRYDSPCPFKNFVTERQTEDRLVKLVEKSIESKLNSSNPHSYDLVWIPVIRECQQTSNAKLLVLALVIISANRFERRREIRETWANRTTFHSQDLRVLFAVGLDSNPNVSKSIELEFFKYNDIVMGNLSDLYQNLTRKVMMAFKWATENCRNARFIMRINDDVMVNTPMLLEYMKRLQAELKNAWLGNWYDYQFSIRDTNSKYYISSSDYSGDKYAAYMEGSMYILTFDLAERVLNLSLRVYWPPFSVWLEDIYVGMLCIYLRAEAFNLNGHFSSHGQDEVDMNAMKKRSRQEVFFVYMKTISDFNGIWKFLIDQK